MDSQFDREAAEAMLESIELREVVLDLDANTPTVTQTAPQR